MPPTIKEKPASTSNAQSFSLAGVRKAAESLTDAVDSVLVRAVNGEAPTDTDLAILHSAGIIRPLDVTREVARMRGVMNLQSIAGTTEERAEAQQAASATDKEMRDGLPEIDRQISELNLRRELLKSASEKAQQNLATMLNARALLRERRKLPDSVVQECRALDQQYRSVDIAVPRRLVEDRERMLRDMNAGAEAVLDNGKGAFVPVTPELLTSVTSELQQFKSDVEACERLQAALDAEREMLINRYVR